MPRYYYNCTHCGATLKAFHSMDETLTDCMECETSGSLSKGLSMPLISTKVEKADKKVGTLTLKSIEENREILNKAKEEAKNKSYDKT